MDNWVIILICVLCVVVFIVILAIIAWSIGNRNNDPNKLGCSTDANCSNGQVCLRNICVYNPRLGCSTDANCSNGQICSRNICVNNPDNDNPFPPGKTLELSGPYGRVAMCTTQREGDSILSTSRDAGYRVSFKIEYPEFSPGYINLSVGNGLYLCSKSLGNGKVQLIVSNGDHDRSFKIIKLEGTMINIVSKDGLFVQNKQEDSACGKLVDFYQPGTENFITLYNPASFVFSYSIF